VSEQPTQPMLPVPPEEGEEAVELVLREERPVVGTEQRVVGRVHLRRRVVTEVVTLQVELRREELVIERETIEPSALGAGLPPAPEALTDGEPLVVVLHEEQPVVEKRIVPVERVVLRKSEAVERVDVEAEVGREVAEVDGRPLG
jgi:uncharacterized protein (TIGR02271 family)